MQAREMQTCEMPACEMQTCEMPACEMQTCEMQTCEMPACEMQTCEMQTCEMPACETQTCEIQACEMQTWKRFTSMREVCLPELRLLFSRCTHLSQGVHISWARASHGRVSFAGMHLKNLHLVRAYTSQDVHLRCVYHMGVVLSRACIAVPKPPYPNCVPGR